MKAIKYILSLSLILVCLNGCNNDDFDVSFIDSAPAPANVSAVFTITQDNSGMVSIRPNGEGVVVYEVDFGDGSELARTAPGEILEHVYAEGVYNVIITGIGINGDTTSTTQELTVTFAAPENLMVTISPVPGDVLSIDVSATADNETFFEVYFGEDPQEEPVQFMEGETVRHTYAATGDYDVTVVALSGGAATVDYLQTVSILDPVLLPLDFESATVNYNWIGFGSSDFGAIPAGVIPNPDVSGINTSDTVSYVEKSAGAQVWAGASLDLSEAIDFTNGTTISMKTWAPRAGVPVMFKLEDSNSTPDMNGNPSVFVEIITNTTQANTWETLLFDLTTDATFDPGISYDRVIIFYDFGNAGVGETLYYDDIQIDVAALPRPSLPIDFEQAFDYTWNGFGASDFGAIPSGVIPNPDMSGINTSDNVVFIEKTAGAQVWAGASLDLDGAIDFTDGTTISMSVWAPQAGVPVMFKLEDSNSTPDMNGNPSVFVEIITNTTQANTWETLEFDLTTDATFSAAISYDRVIIFYDFGNGGTGATSYYDDIQIAGLPRPSIPIDFEQALDYNWIGFGASDFGAVPSGVIPNPDMSGINTSDNVVFIEKPVGAQVWSGASLDLDGPIDFSAGTTASMKVWAPQAGVPVLFKLEDSTSPPDMNGNPSVFVEIITNTTQANTWETLTFDLTSEPAFNSGTPYDRVIIFYDFGNAGTGTTSYYDDIELTN